MPELTALIPLDGTKMSEEALELLPFLKSVGFAEICLVSIWGSSWELREGETASPQLRELEEKGRAYLSAYLREKTVEIEKLGFKVRTALRIGGAAEEVLAESAEHGSDLIVIATHGRSGIERWRLGSVADKIVRGADSPVLLIGPNVRSDLAQFTVKRILVPLDGSRIAEAALPVARWLLRATGATLDLVDVVSMRTVAYATPGDYSVDVLGLLEESANAYLAEITPKLSAAFPVTSTVRRGYPPDELILHAIEQHVDLIIMTTRARHGLGRSILGSVADRILLGPAPVLLLRQEEVAKSRLAE